MSKKQIISYHVSADEIREMVRARAEGAGFTCNDYDAPDIQVTIKDDQYEDADMSVLVELWFPADEST